MEQSAIYDLHKEIFEFATNAHFDLRGVSKHIALKIIEENPNCDWDWCSVASNPNTTFEYIVANKSNEDLWWFLSSNPNTKFEYILSNFDKYKIMDWTRISSLNDVTFETTMQYPDLPWCWEGLSINRNITWQIVQANPDKPWNWRFLSENPNITCDIIHVNPDKPWHWEYISSNPNITWEFVKENIEKNWDFSRLSNHPNITWDIINNNLEYDWSWEAIGMNPNISLEIILSNLTKWEYSWSGVSMNPNITWESVRDRIEWSMSPDRLRAYPSVVKKDGSRIYYAPRSIVEIYNRSLNCKLQQLCLITLLHNPAIYKPSSTVKANTFRKWRAANVIKRAWFRCITNPEYAVCKKRILSEFKQILDLSHISGIME